MTALSPGDRLDRYELLCVLAQGGMGTVWLARLTGKHGFERLVAIKTILATHDGDRHFSDMFLDEGRIASQIDHENVARILEIGEDRGVIYHAMELIDGESLRKLYRDVRAAGAVFPLNVALRIMSDLCAGLHAVHELRGSDGAPLEVVHRDVSPQNILVTVRGTVKLIDFGVAKARERRIEDTTAGTLKGKIEYMAPEQAMSESIDRRADVYAIGAVLYEILAGKPVRKTDEGRQLLALHELMTGVPYEPLHESIPLSVRLIVDRALARDPQHRFQTADDMRRALESAMLGLGRVATTDDVAKVLSHFSHERTQKRKDAIDAAARSAQALERERQLRSGQPAMHSAPPSAHGHAPTGTALIEGAVGQFEEPATRPSMRTMQGASVSGMPVAERAGLSQTQVFKFLIGLSAAAIIGVVLSFAFTKTPSAGNASAGPKPSATLSATAPPAVPPPTAVTAPGPSATETAVHPPAPPAPTTPPKPAVTTPSTAPVIPKAGGPRKSGGDAPKPARPSNPKGDEYGF